MDIPPPKPAQVIRYAYLWADEHDAGREEGAKDRPAAVVMTMLIDEQDVRVVVLPITHAPPSAGTDAVAIPAAIKRSLGLDDDPSWIVVDELNVFVWPGPDLRQVSAARDTCLYGYLPAGFFNTVRERAVSAIRQRRTRQVPRSE